MNWPQRILIVWVAAILATGASAADLNVFAAASLSEALAQVGADYGRATGDHVRFNFGGSGALALQIKLGAPADVIVSADELRVDQLEKAGLIIPGTRRAILANQLVVIVPAAENSPVVSPADLEGAGIRRIAIGQPDLVPAGAYARDYLERLGLWEGVRRRLVPLDNVRAVMEAVGSGDVEAGFVYRTDALFSGRVRVAISVPLADGPRITYPVAVIRSTREPGAAKSFAAFLSGAEAQAVFAKFGFLQPN
jgi:molybdate transport system substrate-binding protein